MKRFDGLFPDVPVYSPLRLTWHRQKLGLTKKEAAFLLGANTNTWCAWESGRNPMPSYAWELWVTKARVLYKYQKSDAGFLDSIHGRAPKKALTP